MSGTRLAGLADAADSTIQCRDEGHLWNFVNDSLTEHKGRVIEFVQERWCTRCGCTRSRHIQVPTMAVMKTTYRYPDGFLMEPGSGRTRPKDVRREVLSRVVASRSHATSKVHTWGEEAS